MLDYKKKYLKYKFKYLKLKNKSYSGGEQTMLESILGICDPAWRYVHGDGMCSTPSPSSISTQPTPEEIEKQKQQTENNKQKLNELNIMEILHCHSTNHTNLPNDLCQYKYFMDDEDYPYPLNFKFSIFPHKYYIFHSQHKINYDNYRLTFPSYKGDFVLTPQQLRDEFKEDLKRINELKELRIIEEIVTLPWTKYHYNLYEIINPYISQDFNNRQYWVYYHENNKEYKKYTELHHGLEYAKPLTFNKKTLTPQELRDEFEADLKRINELKKFGIIEELSIEQYSLEEILTSLNEQGHTKQYIGDNWLILRDFFTNKRRWSYYHKDNPSVVMYVTELYDGLEYAKPLTFNKKTLTPQELHDKFEEDLKRINKLKEFGIIEELLIIQYSLEQIITSLINTKYTKEQIQDILTYLTEHGRVNARIDWGKLRKYFTNKRQWSYYHKDNPSHIYRTKPDAGPLTMGDHTYTPKQLSIYLPPPSQKGGLDAAASVLGNLSSSLGISGTSGTSYALPPPPPPTECKRCSVEKDGIRHCICNPSPPPINCKSCVVEKDGMSHCICYLPPPPIECKSCTIIEGAMRHCEC